MKRIILEINEIESRKSIENKINSWFFEIINTISKPLARLTKKTEVRRHKLPVLENKVGTSLQILWILQI